MSLKKRKELDSPPPAAGGESSSPLSAEKYDAVHRALLTGLLGNIAFKNDNYEYIGARNAKLAIFPGSGLFRRGPKWIVAAELVETTRLYARTAARIAPQWIEQVGAHLVGRTYNEPRWQEQTAHVIASEKVSLYGLTIVAARPVHYGPIEPRISRDIFIEHALVEGEFITPAPFFKHNAQLKAEIEAMEAKIRRRDVLVDPGIRFKFYDARIPQGIYNGPLFEKWRREAEKANPQLLFMDRSDLMRYDTADINSVRFPDALVLPELPGAKLPLQYRFEPGADDDGITASIPLAALNQAPAARFEWLVPGMLNEKILAMIRSLPKPLRVAFVPAYEAADAASEALRAENFPLSAALANFLGKRSGQTIRPSDFDLKALPPWLKMNFRILDARGKPLAGGRDLSDIRQRLGVRVKETFAALPPSELTKAQLTHWDFGDLPERVEIRRAGLAVYGYPALVDRHASVSIEVLDSPDSARLAMRAGLRRLFMLQVRSELRYLERNIPGIETMSLHYATLGSYKELKADLLAAAADHAFFGPAGATDITADIRTQAEYIRRAEIGWRKLNGSLVQIAETVASTLAIYQETWGKLSERPPPLMVHSFRDMQEQINYLLPKHFIVCTPHVWLAHFPRYFKAISSRLNKLKSAGLNRDQLALLHIGPLWTRYKEAQARHAALGIRDPQLEAYRWMLEELRVSLFAQELKTAMPVSPQRLEKQWELVQRAN